MRMNSFASMTFSVSGLTVSIFIVLTDICTWVLAHDIGIFGTKTAYKWAHPPRDIKTDQYLRVLFGQQVCHAVHLSGLFRHGSRTPSVIEIDMMTELHKKLLSYGTNDPSSFIHTWLNPFGSNEELITSDFGREEHRILGQRYGQRFKSMFRRNTENIKMLASPTERATTSAISFYEGLREMADSHVYNAVEPHVNESILRSQKDCPKYISSVEQNITALHEYVAFQEGPAMSTVIRNVCQRLGLKSENITGADIEVMWWYCAYELQFFGESSWCGVLDEEDLKALEYQQDLAKYWVYGYGLKMTADLRCPLVSDIFSLTDRVIRSRRVRQLYPPAKFWFGHAGTVSPVYAALGLFKDSAPLKASNYESQQDRAFRTSEILPFAANFALVLYECGRERDNDKDYVMRWFVNEKPILIPACKDYVCPYNKIRQKYRHYIDECSVSNLCSQLD